MKKIITLFFLVVNLFLFFGILEIYEEKDHAYINQIERVNSQVYHEWVLFSDESGNPDSEKIFDLFQELTEKYNLLISIRIRDEDTNAYEIYLSSSMNIDQRLKLVTDVSLNFNESENSFYTSRKDDPEGQYFYLLNKDLNVNIYPIRYLKKMPNTMISFVADTREELEDSIQIFMEHYGAFSSRMGEPEATVYETREKIDSFLPMTIFFAMLSSFLLIMMYIHARSKKIAIFHTMGLSLSYTAFKLFFSLLFSVFLTIAATNFILFILFVGIINTRTIPMITDLVRAAMLQIIGIVLVVALSCLLLNLIPVCSMLKNARMNHKLMRINYVLKILILIALLPSVADRTINILHLFTQVQYITKVKNDNYQYVSRYKSEYTFDGYKIMDYLQEYIQENDPAIIYKYDILQKYHEAYEILNDAGALYCNSYTLYGNESGIMVNENYIKKYPVKDIDGNWIDFDQINADVIYMVPEYYLDKLPKDFYHTNHPEGETAQMIVISNQQNIFDFDLPEYEFMKRPYLITLFKDTAFRLDKSIFGNVYVDGDISELLKDTIFQDKIVISKYKDMTDETKNYLMKNIYRESRIVIPVLILIVLIILQYAYLYSKEYKKRLLIRKILGHNPFSIYLGLLLESGFAVLMAFIAALLRKTNVTMFPFVLTLDILVYVFFVLISQEIDTKKESFEES